MKKATYKDLAQKYGLLQSLMDYIPDVIYFKDRKGRLVLVNQAHARGLGLKPEQVAGKTDFDIFGRKRALLMAKDDEYVMTTGKPVIDKVERSTRADGIDNYVSTTKIPRYDNKGRIVGLVGITRDITNRFQVDRLRQEGERLRKKLQSLEELNRMKSDFISLVSHELKTPLAIIKEGVSLVLDGVRGEVNPEQKELLVATHNNAERLRRTIEELLEISRLEKGKVKLRYTLVNLNNLISDSASYYQRLTQEKSVQLSYKLSHPEVNIFLDPERVNEIISNLVDNAIKFTEKGGTIQVEMKVFEDKVRVAVLDTGVGIAKEDLEKIFQRFIQADHPQVVKNKGIGLGLSIVKELVALHGGEVWVESKLGIGSRFYFTLPRFFTSEVLNKEIRAKINTLLEEQIPLYLINLLIINFKDFTRLMRLKSRWIIQDLEMLMDAILKEFHPSGRKHKFFFTDFKRGERSIILPEAKDQEANRLASAMHEKIAQYFAKNKITDVFVNIGVMDLPEKIRPVSGATPANIHIKRIRIGAEKRHFRRVNYLLSIEVVSDGRQESVRTVDISLGGLSFASRLRFETDALLSLKLQLPKEKKALSLTGRVAWIRELAQSQQAKPKAYKIGLEFVRLKAKEKLLVSRFIHSIRQPSDF